MNTITYISCQHCAYTIPECEVLGFCPSCGNELLNNSSKHHRSKDYRSNVNNVRGSGFSTDPNYHQVPPDFDYDYWANYVSPQDDLAEKIVGAGLVILAGIGVYRLLKDAADKKKLLD